jgi:hypothetical protein
VVTSRLWIGQAHGRSEQIPSLHPQSLDRLAFTITLPTDRALSTMSTLEPGAYEARTTLKAGPSPAASSTESIMHKIHEQRLRLSRVTAVFEDRALSFIWRRARRWRTFRIALPISVGTTDARSQSLSNLALSNLVRRRAKGGTRRMRRPGLGEASHIRTWHRDGLRNRIDGGNSERGNVEHHPARAARTASVVASCRRSDDGGTRRSRNAPRCSGAAPSQPHRRGTIQ